MSRTTVVVITQDRPHDLTASLDRLAELPERPPVLVVDNGSQPPVSRASAERFPHWRLIRLPSNRGAAGRNIGVATAATPYVAFADDDTWWEPGALDRAADVLDAQPTVAVVNAHIVVEPGGVEDPVCIELRETPLAPIDGIPGHCLGSFLAGATVLRRAAFLDMGGFEPRFLIGGEEELLATDLRTAGWHLVHLPDVRIHHRPSTSRDPHLRRRQGIRNHLWYLWLRRPWPSALRRSMNLLRRSPHDRHTALAALEALAGAGWVRKARRPVPSVIEREQRLLEASQDRSVARQYAS